MNRICKPSVSSSVSFLFALLSFCILFFAPKADAQAQTSTVLEVSPACLTEGCVVTLTATVTSSGSLVAPGLVTFCDKGPQNCEAGLSIGTAQLLANGTAVVRVGLAAGLHSLRAIFHGTKSHGGSTSASHSLAVTADAANRSSSSGYGPTVVEGADGGFQFTGSVNLIGPLPPTGTISFLDSSQNNLNLGSAAVVPGPVSQSFINTNTPFGGQSFAEAVLTGDFNNDGFQDAAEIDWNGLLTVGLGDG